MQEPTQSFGKFGQLLEHAGIQHLDDKERNETNHRPHAQRHAASTGHAKDVVIEFVALVPEANAVTTHVRHGLGNVEEMLEELGRDVFVDVIRTVASSRAMRIRFKVYIAIHAVPSDWLMCPPVGSGALRSKMPMLSSPRNPPRKILRPSASFRFTHQVKFSSSLWKTRSRKTRSPFPPCRVAVHLINAPGRPGMHRRIHVAERPLVGRKLAVRMHVPFAREES